MASLGQIGVSCVRVAWCCKLRQSVMLAKDHRVSTHLFIRVISMLCVRLLLSKATGCCAVAVCVD